MKSHASNYLFLDNILIKFRLIYMAQIINSIIICAILLSTSLFLLNLIVKDHYLLKMFGSLHIGLYL